METVVLSTKEITVKEMGRNNEGKSASISKNSNRQLSPSRKKQKRKKPSSPKKLRVSTKSRYGEPILALDMFWTRCLMDKLHGTGWRKEQSEPIWKLVLREVFLCAFVLWIIVSLGQEIQHDQLLLDRFGNPEMLPDRLIQRYCMSKEHQTNL